MNMLLLNGTMVVVGLPERQTPIDVSSLINARRSLAVMSLMLKVGPAENVRTKTLKAFTAEEGMRIIKDLP